MKKLIIFFLCAGLTSCLVRTETKDGWAKLKVRKFDSEPISIHGLAINRQGVIITAGYTEESHDCGPLGVGVCRLYRIYRSMDKGNTWEEVSDSTIAYEHAFVKGDKLPDDLAAADNTTLGKLYLAAKSLSGLFYMDHEPKGRFVSVDNDFYLLMDDKLYISRDSGKTWQALQYEPDNKISTYAAPYYTRWDLVEIAGDHLAVHHYTNGYYNLYKKSLKGFRETKIRKHFAVLHQPDGQKQLLIADGKNMASDYYLNGNNRLTKDALPGAETYRLSNIYHTEEGPVYATILNDFIKKRELPAYKDKSNTVHLWKSVDRGHTFEKIELGGLNQDKSAGHVNIMGKCREYLILMITKPVFDNDKVEDAETLLQDYFVYNIQTNELRDFPFPEGTHGLRKSIKMFAVEDGAVYCGTPDGLYKTYQFEN